VEERDMPAIKDFVKRLRRWRRRGEDEPSFMAARDHMVARLRVQV
jgi:hypothetical protein